VTRDRPGARRRKRASERLTQAAVKRLLDLVAAVTALIVLSPVIVAIAIAIKLESPGPVLYRSRRVGFGGRELWMLKFRKMRGNAAGPALTAMDDERFTRLGRFLTTTRLDELPQLWNVLTGSMSLVGPRPEDPSFVTIRKADYVRILHVTPGITGLTQLAFARESEILDEDDPVGDYIRRLLPEKTRIDQLYVSRRSLLMDLRILAWSATAVLFRTEVAVNRSTGALSVRRRPATPVLAADQLDAQAEVAS
jgi:lipopolysaccharide/colanic/teichoic acid biosynthesis glycosyltransferase